LETGRWRQFFARRKHGQQDQGRRTYRGELDLETRVWTRARVFPVLRLDSRLIAKNRGKVRVTNDAPGECLNGASIMQEATSDFNVAERENNPQSDIPLR
jgi:hypothetical protein